jgi:hypothetical protein
MKRRHGGSEAGVQSTSGLKLAMMVGWHMTHTCIHQANLPSHGMLACTFHCCWSMCIHLLASSLAWSMHVLLPRWRMPEVSKPKRRTACKSVQWQCLHMLRILHIDTFTWACVFAPGVHVWAAAT